MDLVKKVKEITIEDEEFIMTFDMQSIATYKELTNRFFSKGITELFKQNDEEVVYFIASILRRKATPTVPLGRKVIDGDTLFFLLNLKNIAIEIIAESLPNDENSSKKK